MNDFNHNKVKNDLLYNIYNNRKINVSQIGQIHAGKKYTAVEDISGHIGVCSNLNVEVVTGKMPKEPDFKNEYNRIVINALVNACINPKCNADGEGDISEVVNFSGYRKIAMIGFFESLYLRLCAKGVNADIFEKLINDNPNISDIRKMQSVIPHADSIILTATTVSNNTFNKVMNMVNAACHVFLLGPSAILDREIMSSYIVAGIFGAQFFPGVNDEIANIILLGKGTKSFLHLMKKIYILRSDDGIITC